MDAQIINGTPNISIFINFKDDFSNDRYIFKSQISDDLSSNNILFSVLKNGKKIGEINLTEQDLKEFFENFFLTIEDIEFKNEFYKENFQKIELEVKKFLKYFEENIILNTVTLEGEFKRMQKVAGIS